MIVGGHMHDNIELLSSEASRVASGNASKRNECCNASTNPIPRVKLVDTNLVECF